MRKSPTFEHQRKFECYSWKVLVGKFVVGKFGDPKPKIIWVKSEGMKHVLGCYLYSKT